MSKWNVSEQSIYDENGQLIIEASEWYMREDLQKICDEHNANEMFKGNIKLSEKVKNLLQTNKKDLAKWVERCAWHCSKVTELNEALKWIKEQYDNDFTEDELNNLEPRDKAIYSILKEKII